MKFLVCNKWELEISDKYMQSAFSGKGMDRPYFQFVVQRPKEVVREAWCYEYLLNYIAHIEKSNPISAAEYFEGMGMNAKVEDIEDYAIAFSEWLENRYEYGIACGAYHHAASYFLLMPQQLLPNTLDMVKVPQEADNHFRRIV